ncbi:MAG: hypothetical protein GY759_20545 [Chloroflexi bacterium]|nr:hypothetical protein [Chloroflexota bacterium]
MAEITFTAKTTLSVPSPLSLLIHEFADPEGRPIAVAPIDGAVIGPDSELGDVSCDHAVDTIDARSLLGNYSCTPINLPGLAVSR